MSKAIALRVQVKWLGVLLCTVLLAVGCGSDPVTFIVTSLDDSGPGTLREAISDAGPGDIIDLDVVGEITLSSGELVIGKKLQIQGPGADELAIKGNLVSRVFAIISGGDVAISGVTIALGSNTDGDGGAIVNIGTLTLIDAVVMDSVAGLNGGGISNNGKLTLVNTVVTGNDAGGEGGGIWNAGDFTLTRSTVHNNSSTMGGGISSVGTLTVTYTTVRGNSAVPSGGGGIFTSGITTLTKTTVSGNLSPQGGGIQNFGRLTLTNSTVSGNTAIDQGGGIQNVESLTLINSTISDNTAGKPGGGIHNGSGALTLTNSIIAHSDAGDACGGQGVTSLGHNLDSDGTCGLSFAGDLSNTHPMLSPLQDNGGPTFTQALFTGSPAIDGGDDSVVDAPLVLDSDQRGVARLLGAHVDIGTYEWTSERP